jgi:Ca2+-binding RTX toxin-like protein
MGRLVLFATLATLALASTAEASTIHAEEVWRSEVGKLVYTAAPGETNRVALSDQGDALRVDDLGALIFSSDNPTDTFSCAAAAHTALCQGWYFGVLATLGDGNDTLRNLDTAKVPGGEVDGGAGDDRLDGGSLTVIGGPGADDLRGRADYGASPGPVSVTFDDNANDGVRGEHDNTHGPSADGSTFADSLTGNAGDNYLSGDAGADLIRGGSGSDVLYGDGAFYAPTADGGDTLVGGPGLDYFYGEGGDDVIDARDGELDYVTCDDGADRVRADAVDSVNADCETVTRG